MGGLECNGLVYWDCLLQGISFAGPGLCLIACALLTPHGAAHAPGTTPTSLIVALFSAAFAMGAWSRAGLYCNHQVHCTPLTALPAQISIMV